jgi:hypothetical protein
MLVHARLFDVPVSGNQDTCPSYQVEENLIISYVITLFKIRHQTQVRCESGTLTDDLPPFVMACHVSGTYAQVTSDTAAFIDTEPASLHSLRIVG